MRSSPEGVGQSSTSIDATNRPSFTSPLVHDLRSFRKWKKAEAEAEARKKTATVIAQKREVPTGVPTTGPRLLRVFIDDEDEDEEDYDSSDSDDDE